MFDNFEEHWKFWYQPDITFKEAIYVHPLKQWDVQLLKDHLWFQPNIMLLVVFGSAVDISCNSDSDVDIYMETVDGKCNYTLPYSEYLSGSIDVLCNLDDWNTPIGKEIAQKGIVLFDRRATCRKEMHV